MQILQKTIDPIYNVENYSKEIKYRLQRTHTLAKDLIEKHKLRNKVFYDRFAKPLTLNINDKILIQKEPYDKHKSIYDGPYVVRSIEGCNVTVYDKLTKKIKTIHKNRIRKA